MKQLPQSITDKAYISPGSQEMAWKRADLKEALKSILETDQAILGGEVWVVRDLNKNWSGLIPSKDGSPPGIWTWDISTKQSDESWKEYCERTFKESLDEIRKLNVEQEASQEVVPFIWFNLTYIEENEA